MQGKVVVITGGTSGIGLVAAERLAERGARLVLVARDPDRGKAALARLAGSGHSLHLADLSLLSDMKRAAAEIAAAEPRIDVLINNAGAIFARRTVTADGLERTFALNHMAYFVFTAGLRHRLEASAPARIVNTASGAHRRPAALNFADLQSARRYRPFDVYACSKLCNLLFTRALARRLAGTGVTANCLHPGFVATRFGDQSGGLYATLVRIAKWFAISPDEGARTLVWLAAAPEAASVSGAYFSEGRPDTPSPAAQDDEAAERLWRESERLASQPVGYPDGSW